MKNWLEENLQGISAFLFFTLLLSVKSGYGIPAILSLLISFCFFKKIQWNYLNAFEILFAFCLFIFALLWGWSFDFDQGDYRVGDYFFKYFFAIFVFVSAIFIKVKKVYYLLGLAIGCIFAFFIAIWQFKIMGRAEGFTNAIRFGNLSLWMSCACLIFALIGKLNLKSRIALVGASILGMSASLLSLSRGGWIFVFIVPFVFLIFCGDNGRKMRLFIFSLFVVCIVAFFAMQIPLVEKRIGQAKTEVVNYLDGKPKSAETSVGARLEQWSLAWKMGLEKPLWGWGEQGYLDGRRNYVLEGKADSTVVNYGHAHNEFLNIFAKKGVVGVFGLLLIYIAPILLFWPKKMFLNSMRCEKVADYKAVCFIGLSIPLSYVVFGVTEYFFYLNIGHIFYIFSIVYTYSLLKSVQEELYD